MFSEQDLFASCVRSSRGGPPSLGVDVFAASWKAMLRWLRGQVTSGNGGSVQGLGKFVWCTTPAGGPPAPCFVLSERFLHLQLQLGAGITRSASVQRAVGSCEEVNFAKLALSYGKDNLSRDQVATCIKATLHHLSDLVQQGAAIQLDLGVGALTIRGGRADFCFRAGLQQAAADVGPSAAPVGAPLTAEAVQHMTDALGNSGFTTPARSTVSRVSAKGRHDSDIFGTSEERAASTASYTTSAQEAQHGYNNAKAPPAPRSESLPGGPGCMLKGETHAAAVARISQAAMVAAREGREAARTNAKVKPAHFILPVGGPGDEDDDEPRLRQGKGKSAVAGAAHASTTNTILGEVLAPPSPKQQQQAGGRPGNNTVLEAAALREAEHKQRLLAQQEKVLLGMAQRKAVLDEEAAALVTAQKEKQKQLAADLAQQIKSRQAAVVGARTAAPDAGQEAPLLAGSLDSAGSIAKRHQQQVLYRAELELQMAAKEQVRMSTAAAERQQDQQRLAQVQEELVRSVQTTKDMAKQKQCLFRQQLDQQVATRGVRESFMD